MPRLSPFAVSALLLAGALALACKSKDDPPVDTTCTLRQLNESCQAPGDCCSGNCQGNRCVDSVCDPLGTSCSRPSDCCSGKCNGECVEICEPVGAACDAPTDCCTNECGGVIGAQTCREPPIACLKSGETCGATGNCCSPLECDATSSKCVQPAGDTCLDAKATCTAGWQCCSRTCDATGHCWEDAGICDYAGERCTTDSDCCSQSCENGTCGTGVCRQVDQTCSDGSVCCSGLCGADGLCDALPPGPTGKTCKTLGEACALGADCCSTNCQGGSCKPAATCNAFGDVCVTPDDCCSGQCAQSALGQPGRCDDAPGGCALDGYPCTSDSGCCTRRCVDLGTGAKVCQPSGGCRLNGNYCDSTNSCCNVNYLQPSSQWIACDPEDHVCDNGGSCNPPGDICGLNANASQNCCFGKKDVCKYDANGIPRCFGGPPNHCTDASCDTVCPTGWDGNDPQCCIQPGEICQFRDQCCGFAPCVPDPEGVLRCGEANACLPSGAICSVGGAPTVDPCCDGTTCREILELGWACSNAPGPCSLQGQECNASNPCCFGDCVSGFCGKDCAPNGDACAAAADCCSGLCDASGVCVAACMAETGSCTVTEDCCAGLTCEIPDGKTSGTCQTGGGTGPTCAATAQSCISLPCCDAANTCTGGVCTPPEACHENYQSCTSGGNECCAPLGCYTTDQFENRSECGPTSVNCFCDTATSCVAIDAPCSTLVDCCSGYCKDNGSPATCTSTDPAQCSCKPVG